MSYSARSARPSRKKAALDRGCLLVLVLIGAYTGLWAYLAPSSWYDGFPGLGLSWLPQLGPYNEHFARDIGATSLALTALCVVALWRFTEVVLTRIAGGAWLVFNVLHGSYHLTMQHMYTPRDQILNVIVLGLQVVVSFALVLPAPRSNSSDHEESGEGALK